MFSVHFIFRELIVANQIFISNCENVSSCRKIVCDAECDVRYSMAYHTTRYTIKRVLVKGDIEGSPTVKPSSGTALLQSYS